MGMAGEIRGPHGNGEHEGVEDHAPNAMLRIGNDERRMHVRAYNHWISLLNGRAFPAMADLDPTNNSDFGRHSVLLDFSQGVQDPVIRFLGETLRSETSLPFEISKTSQVPIGSLLSQLIGHHAQIFANRAPIGFEDEFVNLRGNNTLYRGILLPLSSNGTDIDGIYGVLNWKELVDDALQALLMAEVEAARRDGPAPQLAAPIWADGPNATTTRTPRPKPVNRIATSLSDSALADHLLLAREAAEAADARIRSELHQALARAYNFALAANDYSDAYRRLIDKNTVTLSANDQMEQIIELVFGTQMASYRRQILATALTHAKRNGVSASDLASFLDSVPGGIEAISS